MFDLIATIACLYVWLTGSEAFSLFLFRFGPSAYAATLQQYGAAILAALLIALLLVLKLLPAVVKGGRGGDGLRNSALGRRMTGLASGMALYAALAIGNALILRAIFGAHIFLDVTAALFAWRALRPAKIFLGRSTRPLRKLIAGRHVGMGGTARFSGLMDEWANPWRSGQILLGASLYDPKWLVGMDDDRHIVTIATSRAGKGRSVIIPNLLTWPGSALVIDPKGQNACVTALKRGDGGGELAECLGQTVRILDPLGEITDARLNKYIARFNPLAELDPSAADYSERIDLIADALVVPTSSKDSFFDNSARALIGGLIDYAMMSPNVGNDERNLGTVRGLLTHPDGPPLEEMAELGGLAQAGAAGRAAGREKRGR